MILSTEEITADDTKKCNLVYLGEMSGQAL